MKPKLAVIVLAGFVAVAAADAPSVWAANSRTYVDGLGDVTCCTRDISRVKVANDDAGMITFAITALDTTQEGDEDDDLYIDIGSDRDYTIWANIESSGVHDVVLGRRSDGGVSWVELSRTAVRGSVTGDVFRFTLDRHVLGDTDWFSFRVMVEEVCCNAVDVAPERDDVEFEFPVKIALARLRSVLSTPTSAVAGRAFVARLGLRVGGSRKLLASGRIACHATVAGHRLPVLRRGFVARRAFCRWRIPHWASGEVVRGAIGVFVTGQRSSLRIRTFRRRIT